MHPFSPVKGNIETFQITSENLAINLLGDPSTREVSVYTPPNHSESGPYPMFMDLVGFTGSGRSHLNWKAFSESVPQRHERLVSEGKMGPCIFVFPDCFTSLGGNQYIDSIAMGRWSTYLTEEIIPEIDRRYNTTKSPKGRAVFGKSSGGYGTLVQAMINSDFWAAAASHSGDVGFDRLFLGEFPKTLDILVKYGGIEGFLEHIDNSLKIEGDEFHVLMILAMGASYDPDETAYKGVRLPVNHTDCELIPERWENWIRWDPLELIESSISQEGLASMQALYLDCGSRDQYSLHYGTRALTKKLEKFGIPHVSEEFDDTHSSIDYRMDVSLPLLYSAITM